MSTILVTGASGFIGHALCRRLICDGHFVHGISRNSQLSEPDTPVAWLRADLTNAEATRHAVGSVQPDIIFHLASRVTGSRELSEVMPTLESNLASTVNILTSAAEVKCQKVILAGSSEEPVTESDAPCSPYAAAKYSSTTYARMFQSLFDLNVVVPRIFMTYGPGQQDVNKLVPYTILTMLSGEKPKLTSGSRLIDWIYIEDVVEGLTRAAMVDRCARIQFDLGTGSLVSIRSIIEEIAEIVGDGASAEFGALPDRPMEQERAADNSFITRVFGWKPSTSLRNGLERSVEWYRHAYKNVLCTCLLWTLFDVWNDVSLILEPLADC